MATTRTPARGRIFSRSELRSMNDAELTEAIRDLRQLEWIASQTRRGFGRVNAALEDAYHERARRNRIGGAR